MRIAALILICCVDLGSCTGVRALAYAGIATLAMDCIILGAIARAHCGSAERLLGVVTAELVLRVFVFAGMGVASYTRPPFGSVGHDYSLPMPNIARDEYSGANAGLSLPGLSR